MTLLSFRMTSFHLTHRQKTLDLQLGRRRIVIGRIGQIHVVLCGYYGKLWHFSHFFQLIVLSSWFRWKLAGYAPERHWYADCNSGNANRARVQLKLRDDVVVFRRVFCRICRLPSKITENICQIHNMTPVHNISYVQISRLLSMWWRNQSSIDTT